MRERSTTLNSCLVTAMFPLLLHEKTILSLQIVFLALHYVKVHNAFGGSNCGYNWGFVSLVAAASLNKCRCGFFGYILFSVLDKEGKLRAEIKKYSELKLLFVSQRFGFIIVNVSLNGKFESPFKIFHLQK